MSLQTVFVFMSFLHIIVFYAISILILHLDVLCILVSAAKFTFIYYITDCDLTIIKLRICRYTYTYVFLSFLSDCGVSDFIYIIKMSTESF